MSKEVVLVSQRFPPDKGGNAARVHDISVHLADGEWDVTVLAAPPNYPPGEFERSWKLNNTETVDGVTVHRLWSWQPQVENPGTVQRLAYYLAFGVLASVWLLKNSRRYDAVVTTTPPISTGAPGLVASALGKPWVVDVRDLWIDASISLGYLDPDSYLARISRRFQRRVLYASDRIAVTTESLGEMLQETYGNSLGATTMVVPNGVDTERFRPVGDYARPDMQEAIDSMSTTVAVDGDDVRTRADGADVDSPSSPTIIYTGNLGSAQDLESCIRAMSHLRNDEAILKLVGGGDVESPLKEVTDACGLQGRVEFTGAVPRDDVPALLRDASIGVAPIQATDEFAYAMPTKVYEYMATGLPTLVTGTGEIKRFVEESGGGIWTESDPEQIAERLDELLADDELRRRLGENGRAHVQDYDRKQIARRFGAELTELVEGD